MNSKQFVKILSPLFQSRYSGAVLNDIEFYNRTSLVDLQWEDGGGNRVPCRGSRFEFGCR